MVAGTGEKTYQGKRGYPLTVDTSVDEIEAADFDGLVIPGGYAPDIMRRSPKLLQLTREIYQAGKPVAFICHAGWVPDLGRDRKGKRGTSVGAIKDDLVNAGHALGGQPGGGGRKPDLLPDAGRSAAILQGDHRGAGKSPVPVAVAPSS